MAIGNFFKQTGEVILDFSTNITNAPIYIRHLTAPNMLTSQRELTTKLQSFYFQYIVRQVLLYIVLYCIVDVYLLINLL